MKIILLTCALLCSTYLTLAQPGTLDKFFGTGGKVTTLLNHYDDEALATAIQQDGKIVVAGYNLDPYDIYEFIVVRYNSNGTLDNTFGENGKVSIAFGTADFGDNDAFAGAVAIQPTDGKIVVAGNFTNLDNGTYDFAVARLTTSGTLDNSFGSGGKKIIDFGGGDGVNSVAIQADGKIILAGGSVISGNYYTAVARLNGSDGHLDPSFGSGFYGTGKVLTLVGKGSSANSVAIQADGKIVVAGNSYNGSSQNFFAVRYNSNGTLDNTFGNNGKTIIDFGGDDYAKSVAIQADGKVVVAGYSTKSGKNYFAVTKLGPAGIRIGNFGVSGTVTTLIGT